MSFNLLAVGDIHFDAPSVLGEDESAKLEKHKKDAFKKAVDEAIARNVTAMFICGDLYDENAVSFETLIFLRKNFLKLAANNIKVLYAHGKSDQGPAPDLIKTNNLVEFSHEVERYDLTSAQAVPEAIINSCGYTSNAGLFVDQFEEKGSNYPTIGMMYAPEGFSNQGSFILDGFSSLNYDLFILGGYHHYIAIRAEHNIIYVGSPTGTWFGDKAGGALYAEVNDYGQIVLDKISLSDVTWHDIELSNISETDVGTLKRKIEIEIQSVVENTKDAFVKVVLSGRCYLADTLTDEVLDEIKNELSNTLDLTIHIQKQKLLSVLPKTLFDTTSPFVESVKIIDAIKKDDDKFDKAIEIVQKKNELFYSTMTQEQKDKYRSDIKQGLLDAICKVMIKEASYEN